MSTYGTSSSVKTENDPPQVLGGYDFERFTNSVLGIVRSMVSVVAAGKVPDGVKVSMLEFLETQERQVHVLTQAAKNALMSCDSCSGEAKINPLATSDNAPYVVFEVSIRLVSGEFDFRFAAVPL